MNRRSFIFGLSATIPVIMAGPILAKSVVEFDDDCMRCCTGMCKVLHGKCLKCRRQHSNFNLKYDCASLDPIDWSQI